MDEKDLIRKHEGLRLSAYKCAAGQWTIGYGHTAGVKQGDYVSVDEAERLLEADVAAVRKQVMAMAARAGVSLSSCQLGALVSFAYNVGLGAFASSTLWRRVRDNPADPAIASEFAQWVYGSGKVLPGLVARRGDESRLYFSGQ